VHIFVADRVGGTYVGEQTAAAGLCPEREQARIGTVEWNAEGEGKVALEMRSCVRNEVGACTVRDASGDLGKYAGALEELGCERPRSSVTGGNKVQAGAGVPGNDAGKKCEVIVHDALVDRPACDVDQLESRLAEQEEKEQEALLVGLDFSTSRLRAVGLYRWDDHDRFARLVQPHCLPDGDKPALQLVKADAAFVLAEIAELRLAGGHRSRHGVLAASRPSML
jgi:hypothetical protein